MTHLMVDLETLGTKSNSAIISIGAQFFDMETGELGESFHQNITIKSNLEAGLKVNADTALWWMKQEEALELWAKSYKMDLKTVLIEFATFINNTYVFDEPPFIWGNSNRFDLGLLDNAYTALDIAIPWDFRGERDVRTLISFAPEVKYRVLEEAKQEKTVLHNALNDCKLQIKYCVEIYKTLTTKSIPATG